MIILGIDPGLNITGYGVISAIDRQLKFIAAGDIRPVRTKSLPERLQELHDGLRKLIQLQKPDCVVLEMVFSHQDYVGTAARMAHARGVACLAAQQSNVALVEYPTARVKKALTGRGGAEKEQVALMVGRWLGFLDPSWSLDATDALALAIAHAHLGGKAALMGSNHRREHPVIESARRGLPAAQKTPLSLRELLSGRGKKSIRIAR